MCVLAVVEFLCAHQGVLIHHQLYMMEQAISYISLLITMLNILTKCLKNYKDTALYALIAFFLFCFNFLPFLTYTHLSLLPFPLLRLPYICVQFFIPPFFVTSLKFCILASLFLFYLLSDLSVRPRLCAYQMNPKRSKSISTLRSCQASCMMQTRSANGSLGRRPSSAPFILKR